MEIRQLTGLEVHDARYVWSQSFEHGDRKMEKWIEWEERAPGGRTTFGIFHGSALQAAFLLIDETIHLGPTAMVPTGAVCGVGVLPACRGKGYASAGMRASFERMREQGQCLSYLEPFSWEFYGRLGYAWTAPTKRYIVPTRVLAASPETVRVRAAVPADHYAIVDCYTRFAKRYRGMIERRPEAWQILFDASKTDSTYTYLYEREGAVEGYVCLHGGKREETKIDEFIALTPRALRGLLGLLKRHEMQVDKFRWDAPPDDALWSTLADNSIETILYSRTMARIVDVAGALQAICPPPDLRGDFTVGVIDESAKWNHGTWRVVVENGAVHVMQTQSAPHVTLDIQTLVQAYLGSPTVPALRSVEKMEVADEVGFRSLAALLAGPPAWCNDGF